MAKGTVTYEQLTTAFRHRNFRPIYFLYGEEGYLAEELQDLLRRHGLEAHERDFNLDIVYGAEADARQVVALCSSYPMMAERRVVIVRDFDKLKDNHVFKEYAARPNPTAVVMLVCSGRPNLSTHPYRALHQTAVSLECKPLYERQMPGWIQERAKALGYDIEAAAVRMLTDFVGNDLRAAAAEIEKLATFAGARKTLTADDVVYASGQTREFNVFELQRALGEGRANDAFRISERMLQHAGDGRSEAIMVIATLSAFFTKLWKLTACYGRMSEQAMASRIGVPPYFIKEYLASLKRYNLPAIESAFAALLAADFEIKGGSSRDARLIITLMLRKMMRAAG